MWLSDYEDMQKGEINISEIIKECYLIMSRFYRYPQGKKNRNVA